MNIKFRRDTAFRKQFFVPNSFSHPAKLDAQLQIWLVEKYSKVGETILDPMFGSGTLMLACTLGRNVIGVELEQKFVDMAKANWEQVKMRPQLGCEMGWCSILQGDARNLEGLLVDKIVTSPPYAETLQSDSDKGKARVKRLRNSGYDDIADRIEVANNWHQHEADYNPNNPSNIGNLAYGSIDKVVTSPPYERGLDAAGSKSAEGAISIGDIKAVCKELGIKHASENMPAFRQKMQERRRQYVDTVITSPPYEGSLTGDNSEKGAQRKLDRYERGEFTDSNVGRFKRTSKTILGGYSNSQDNIGNLKSQSYLEAMLQVYQQCHKVLKPEGLMILVVKNFLREQKEIRLDTDTIKLCEQAGFQFLERHYRELPSQSFWRIIYAKKYPDAPVINKEDVLVFKK